ncbi:MAG: hypothetical protein Q9178_002104 [Gyalolechia marmorata]
MTPPPPFSTLSTPLETFRDVLSGFSPERSNNTCPNTIMFRNPPNALALLHNSSSVLRAQGTKLSLLLLNKPFTPSAIESVLTSISRECLPGLMSISQICTPDVYGDVIHQEVHNGLRDLVSAISRFTDDVKAITEDAYDDSDDDTDDDADALVMPEDHVEKKEDILQVTGQVWSACDRLIEIAKVGVVGVAMDKANEWEALIKDAIDEVEGWDPDTEDDFDIEFDSGPEEGESKQLVKEEQKEVNGIKTNGTEQPGMAHGGKDIDVQSNDRLPLMASLPITDIHVTKAKVLKLLKLIRMLYPALRKRRISTFPPFTRTSSTASLPPSDQITQFNLILQFCGDFSDAADDLADALYDKAPNLVQAKMGLMSIMAGRCVDEVKKGWNDEEDEFTEWSMKWVARVQEVGGRIPEE